MDDTNSRRWELASRVAAGSALAILALRIVPSAALNRDPRVLLLLAAEIVTIALVLGARFATAVDHGWRASLLTLFGTFFLVGVQLGGGQALVPAAVGTAIQMVGLAFQILAKLTLGRSFGLLPANRGVVHMGPYRLVRHPIYLGYFVNHIGFLLTTLSLRNVIIYAALHAIQVARIFEEERLLGRDAEYQRYSATVRYRLFPGLF